MTAFSRPNDRRSTTFAAAVFGLASAALTYAGCGSPTPIIP